MNKNNSTPIFSPFAILGLACVLALSACRYDEKDLFEVSPAERINTALASYSTILQKPPHGWVMEYFPTDTTEGYTFIMKFEKSNKVVMATRNRWVNDVFTTDSCVYSLLADNGPVLSFPVAGTFVNNGKQIGIFHLFSNPMSPLGGSALDGVGLQGDYEFMFHSVTDTLIVLKGKKRKTTIRMYPLSENTTWNNLFERIQHMRNEVLGTSNLSLNMKIGSQNFILKNDFRAYNAKTLKFGIYLQGTTYLTDGNDYAYIFTPDGLKFHTPFEFEDASFWNFKISDDKQNLVAKDKNLTAIISGVHPKDYFVSNNTNSIFVFDMPVGTKFKAVLDEIIANCLSKYNEKFTDLYFRYNQARQSYTLTFKSGRYTGNFDFSRTVNGKNELTLTYLNKKDTNADIYLKNIVGFQRLLDYLNDSFSLKKEGGMGSRFVKCTSITDPEIAFIVNAN